MKKFSKQFENIDNEKLENHIREFSQEFKDEGFSFKSENESNPKIDKIRFYITIQKTKKEGDRFNTVLYQEILEQFLDRIFDLYPDLEYILSTEMKFDKCHTHFTNKTKRLDITNYINTDIKLFNKGINYFTR